jgi:hypothetical protein
MSWIWMPAQPGRFLSWNKPTGKLFGQERGLILDQDSALDSIPDGLQGDRSLPEDLPGLTGAVQDCGGCSSRGLSSIQ